MISFQGCSPARGVQHGRHRRALAQRAIHLLPVVPGPTGIARWESGIWTASG